MAASTAPRCERGHEVRAGAKYCPECGAVVERRCPDGHAVGQDASFCPECGKAVDGPTIETSRSVTDPTTGASADRIRLSGLPSSTPWWLEALREQSLVRASIVTLFLAAVLSIAYSFVYTPRFVFWIAFGFVMFAGVASTRSWSLRAVATFYGIALGAFAVDAIIERIASSVRDLSSRPLSGARLLAYLGSASLAILIVVYFDPARRAQLLHVVAPKNSLDPLRAAAMVALAALALAPVIRSFSGSLQFGVIRSGGALFPGYPSTGDVERFVLRAVDGVYGSEAETDLLECQYFLPSVGPPPLWHCSVKVTYPGEPPAYYDNLQITGRQDGTFDCYDGSQTGDDIC